MLEALAVKQEHFDAAMKKCNPSSLRESVVEVPNIFWEDVGGLEDVKRELRETVEYPVQARPSSRRVAPPRLSSCPPPPSRRVAVVVLSSSSSSPLRSALPPPSGCAVVGA